MMPTFSIRILSQNIHIYCKARYYVQAGDRWQCIVKAFSFAKDVRQLVQEGLWQTYPDAATMSEWFEDMGNECNEGGVVKWHLNNLMFKIPVHHFVNIPPCSNHEQQHVNHDITKLSNKQIILAFGCHDAYFKHQNSMPKHSYILQS